jgi:hypothetical protein
MLRVVFLGGSRSTTHGQRGQPFEAYAYRGPNGRFCVLLLADDWFAAIRFGPR